MTESSNKHQQAASTTAQSKTAAKLRNTARLVSEATNDISLPHLAAEWEKNSQETLRVRIAEYGGRTIVDLRQWYLDKSGELKPSPKGLTVAIAQLPMLAATLTKALAVAREAGLLQESRET